MGLGSKDKKKKKGKSHNPFHKATPEELAAKWSTALRAQMRACSTQAATLQRTENQIRTQVKQHMKKGEKDLAKILAKDLIKSQKARKRLIQAKVNCNSILNQIKIASGLVVSPSATAKAAGTFTKSAEVLRGLNQMISIPELQKGVMDMAQEMEKAGLIDEMVDDIFEEAAPEFDDEDMLDDIVNDIVNDKPMKLDLPDVPDHEEEDEADLESRLKALQAQ